MNHDNAAYHLRLMDPDPFEPAGQGEPARSRQSDPTPPQIVQFYHRLKDSKLIKDFRSYLNRNIGELVFVYHFIMLLISCILYGLHLPNLSVIGPFGITITLLSMFLYYCERKYITKMIKMNEGLDIEGMEEDFPKVSFVKKCIQLLRLILLIVILVYTQNFQTDYSAPLFFFIFHLISLFLDSRWGLIEKSFNDKFDFYIVLLNFVASAVAIDNTSPNLEVQYGNAVITLISCCFLIFHAIFAQILKTCKINLNCNNKQMNLICKTLEDEEKKNKKHAPPNSVCACTNALAGICNFVGFFLCIALISSHIEGAEVSAFLHFILFGKFVYQVSDYFNLATWRLNKVNPEDVPGPDAGPQLRQELPQDRESNWDAIWSVFDFSQGF